MVKATELRVGNFLFERTLNYDDPEDNDYHFEEYIIKDYESMLIFTHDRYYPIPLTEEWLVKLGFELLTLFEGDDPVYCLKDWDIQIDLRTLQPLDAGFPITKYKIEYVHQLQNLYFALTGEELEIKQDHGQS